MDFLKPHLRYYLPYSIVVPDAASCAYLTIHNSICSIFFLLSITLGHSVEWRCYTSLCLFSATMMTERGITLSFPASWPRHAEGERVH